MSEATVTISIADAQTLTQGAMCYQILAAQAQQAAARVQRAVQAIAEAAAEQATAKETDHA